MQHWFFVTKQRKKTLFLVYGQGVIFILLLNTEFIFNGIKFVFSEFYYPTFGLAYHFLFASWIFIVMIAQYELFVLYRHAAGVRKIQIKYLFIGLFVGLLGGITNFLPGYLENVYPFGNISIPIYSIIVTYAILKYRLLNVSLIITRTGIFLAVYSIVLGIPFAITLIWQEHLMNLFGNKWWVFSIA